MIYNIEATINQIFQTTTQGPTDIIEDINNARRLVVDKINSISCGPAIIQGPPGTGKTTVYQLAIRDTVISNNRIDSDEALVCITPTNQLAFDMLRKIIEEYRDNGFDINDILSQIRLYGSKFRYGKFNKFRDPINRDTRIVITTQYQRISGNKRYHLLIDEASKAPLHEPFIPMSFEFARRFEESDILATLSVVGDPKQAISLDSSYRSERGRRLLIMECLLHGLLDENLNVDDVTNAAFERLRGRYFEFLDKTKRLPSPSEQPISQGYYQGRLSSHYRAAERLQDCYNKNEANRFASINEDFNRIKDSIERAITTSRPIIYVRTESFNERNKNYSFNSDHLRTKLALYFAISLAMITRRETTIIAPYIDQIMDARLLYQRKFGSLISDRNMIGFTTVHSMLGSESFNVVSILGKEYSTNDNPTIYYNEPELLNVQLSRHRGVLVIIGNLVRLRSVASGLDSEERTTRYRPISETSAKILELAGYRGRGYRPEGGDGAVYVDYSR